MYIEKLKLLNYRNYSQFHLDFHPKTNIIIGKNAQGKTNIIEAIYYLAIGKSHRTNIDRELIRWESEDSYIKGSIITKNGKRVVEVGLSHNQKKIVKNNGVLIEKTGDLLGVINIVLFSPEDLKLVKEGPIERRNFLDREISNIKPQYYYALIRYNKVLRQRNHLLKRIISDKSLIDTLPTWDEQLIDLGIKIIQTRIYFLRKINSFVKNIHSEITDNNENLELFYQSNILTSQDQIKNLKELFYKKLEKNRNIDIRRGTTSVGPHRDDLKININNIDARSFGSQGQQRTAALSLKLSILELIYYELGEWPILLLDDVLSELDSSRQKKLLNYLDHIQSFITCTDINFVNDFNIKDKKIIKVQGGKATNS